MSVPIWINGLAYLPAVEHEALAAELAEWRGLYEHGLEDRNGLLDRIRKLEAALKAAKREIHAGFLPTALTYIDDAIDGSASETVAEPLHMVAVEDGEIWVYHEGCECQFCKGEAAHRARTQSDRGAK